MSSAVSEDIPPRAAASPRVRVARVTTGGHDARIVSERCEVADSFLGRLRGLLGRSGLEPSQSLLLSPAASVHTAFMRFPIDVVLLDRDLRVVRVVPEVRPWRVVAARGARVVLELRAGEAARRLVTPGDQLTLEEPVG